MKQICNDKNYQQQRPQQQQQKTKQTALYLKPFVEKLY